ncbi:protein mono-ADP-ribosyltransferase PARP12-like [Macrosteles quadrilineatus]|uniref:protein mono-ADP-ribosyltransferase PARP12-like n=1 Tax=Macrosteles quadrilineatus TaxID=74068 RepID=UPI0023E2052E|nr:protein mono-ADP-ribosyltransferase PARP12-like [Macrosteles quadrilineatus]
MKVDNPYLAAMYELTKEEYSSRYGIRHVELTGKMFHATHPSNVDSIVEDNLDWRRVVRCRYGRGTSFSGIADYANCHANRGNGTNRAFIICKVLEYRHTRGTSSMLIPPEGFDTTTGDGEDKIARIICRRAVHTKHYNNTAAAATADSDSGEHKFTCTETLY